MPNADVANDIDAGVVDDVDCGEVTGVVVVVGVAACDAAISKAPVSSVTTDPRAWNEDAARST